MESLSFTGPALAITLVLSSSSWISNCLNTIFRHAVIASMVVVAYHNLLGGLHSIKVLNASKRGELQDQCLLISDEVCAQVKHINLTTLLKSDRYGTRQSFGSLLLKLLEHDQSKFVIYLC